MDNEKIVFRKKIGPKGIYPAIVIPKEIMEYLNWNMEDEMCISTEKGKKGKYLTVWKEEKTEDNKN